VRSIGAAGGDLDAVGAIVAGVFEAKDDVD
jgi:hypothetical protein